jgi:sarcosine oxidase subunit beta
MSKDTIGIIGGGITGASVAYHLSKHSDRDVIVFEKDTLASRTTAKSAAYIGFRGGHTAVQRDLMKYGIQLYNRIIGETGSNSFYRTLGGLDLSTTTEGRAQLRSQFEDTRTPDAVGTRFVEYFEGKEVAESMLLPDVALDQVCAAMYWPNYGYVNPTELAFEFVNRAKQQGVEFRVNTAVKDIIGSGKVEKIQTSERTVSVDHVVAAAGPWNPAICALIDLELPVRHSLAPGLLLEDSTTNRYPSLNHHESKVYLRQHHGDRVFVGHYQGEYQKATEEGPSRTEDVPPETLNTIIDTIQTIVPYLYDADIKEQWVGLRTLTPDTNPIIGRTAIDGFSIVCYNATGIQHAPAAGRVLTEQILSDEKTEYYGDVSISRFDGYHDNFN